MCTSIFEPTASAIAGNARMLDSAPSSWRAAVVAHDQRVGARVDRASRVLDVLDALEDQLAAPAPLDPLDVVQSSVGSNW
jgi:hypothetical protein